MVEKRRFNNSIRDTRERKTDQVDDSRYSILTGYWDKLRGRLSGESLRSWYVYLTDCLVQRVIYGADPSIIDMDNIGYGMDDKESKESLQPLKTYYDSVIFLDKSARPVEWLLRDLWESLSKIPSGDSYKIP